MKKSDKAAKIVDILQEEFPEPPIPLNHEDAVTLLVAVLRSAQCTDERVNRVTPGLFRLANHPQAMAEVPEEDILTAIKSCGLAPTKARNIKKLSVTLAKEFGGVVPEDMATLETLPGVGHKTASVVMSQAFGVPSFPVDTHIFRLARRWGLSRGRNVDQVEVDLKKTFVEDLWNDLHLQIIYFGRKYCPARGHVPEECPICSWAGVKTILAQEAKKSKRPKKAKSREVHAS